MPERNILCLANSRKHGGRCVAGLSADGAGWVRAVSVKDDGTLFPCDYLCADGAEPGPLDLVAIPFSAHRPRRHHPEDWVIDGKRWQRLSRLNVPDLAALMKPHLATGPDLIRGTGDRITHASVEAEPIRASLTLVMPKSIELYRKKTMRGSWTARGRFTLAGATYHLGLTDPVWVNTVTRKEGTTVIQPSTQKLLLTLSLSEMFEQTYFKLIATVLLLPDELGQCMCASE